MRTGGGEPQIEVDPGDRAGVTRLLQSLCDCYCFLGGFEISAKLAAGAKLANFPAIATGYEMDTRHRISVFAGSYALLAGFLTMAAMAKHSAFRQFRFAARLSP